MFDSTQAAITDPAADSPFVGAGEVSNLADLQELRERLELFGKCQMNLRKARGATARQPRRRSEC